MVEITNPPPLYSSQSSASSNTATKEDRAVLSSDFETFLKMLTVQVQNQDPLNPVDSTEYATQLATFSSVEQQVQTNDLLRNISNVLGGNALSEMSRWIGMEGLVRAPAQFSGQPVTVRPQYANGADAAVMVVRNGSGMEVQRFDIEVGEQSVLWGGHDNDGNMLPVGNYSFHIESYDGGKLTDTAMAQVYSTIDEVRNYNGNVMIRMADGTELNSEMINGLRAGDA
ncbi:flagellar hook capping FlgD N-terminal domain-containing protein [Sagittula sp. S175]|uniref:flagellar hook capping FlgD N-terminal domain-containing protein n=1 Tax=Sagittula sp. S175 TaxID=3415129 RepID=UPI003C7CA435